MNEDKWKEFKKLLMEMNKFMGYTAKEDAGLNENQERQEPSKMKTKALYVPSADAVTRTSMLVAYHYYYNALHENDGNDKLQSFEEVFNSFRQGIDPKLEAAYYHSLSGRNLFDVLVVFSSYTYLNK